MTIRGVRGQDRACHGLPESLHPATCIMWGNEAINRQAVVWNNGDPNAYDDRTGTVKRRVHLGGAQETG